MTVLANLIEERARQNRRDHMRYQINRVVGAGRSIILLLVGVWCYTMRGEIQSFITDLLAQ